MESPWCVVDMRSSRTLTRHTRSKLVELDTHTHTHTHGQSNYIPNMQWKEALVRGFNKVGTFSRIW